MYRRLEVTTPLSGGNHFVSLSDSATAELYRKLRQNDYIIENFVLLNRLGIKEHFAFIYQNTTTEVISPKNFVEFAGFNF